jgi:putative ABC transport system permease protein
VDEPRESARIARAIDLRFEAHENQTFSQEDQATIAQLVARFGAVLQALDLVSVLILGVVMLILGNTVALGVRERSKEYATLRALGFQARHVASFILVEAALLGVLGGLACLAVAYPTVDKALSRFLQETAGFPPIQLSASSAVVTLLAGALLGTCSAALPAYEMSKSNIVAALRKVG